MVEIIQDYRKSLEKRRAYQTKEWGKGNWKEGPMDGRIAGDEAGEVEN